MELHLQVYSSLVASRAEGATHCHLETYGQKKGPWTGGISENCISTLSCSKGSALEGQSGWPPNGNETAGGNV